MNALELHAEATPRSHETIEHCRSLVAKTASQLAGKIALVCLALGLVAGIAICVGLLSDPTNTTSTALGMGAVTLFYLGVLPAWAFRRLSLRDVKVAARLARDGLAYRAKVVRKVAVPGSIPTVTIAWRERDRDLAASFQLTSALELADPENVTVLMKPRKTWILAAFADGAVCVGRKVRYRAPVAATPRSPTQVIFSMLVGVALVSAIFVGGIALAGGNGSDVLFAVGICGAGLLTSGPLVAIGVRRARKSRS
jgi:hypothetical protein